MDFFAKNINKTVQLPVKVHEVLCHVYFQESRTLSYEYLKQKEYGVLKHFVV